jgi:peptidoglycan/LPS O-acetylase OafA/YrhL
MNKTTYLSNLTPLRGIAAILTVIFHCNLMVGFALSNSLPKPELLLKMYLMVDFFFILSGFIMLHVYGKWFSDGVTGNAFKKFTIARLARVYPLHILMLLFLVVMYDVSSNLGIAKTPVLEIRNGIYSFVTNVFLLQSMNMHDWFSWCHASWSISTEWWTYMVFPFLVAPILKTNTFSKIAIIVACFLGYASITYLLLPLVTYPAEIPFVKPNLEALAINVGYQYGFIRCICGFIIGMIVHQAYEKNWAKPFFANGFTMMVATIALFILMYFGVRDMVTVALFPCIILSGAYGSVNIDKIFSWNPLQKVGDWSFAIYLVHQPLQYTIGKIVSYMNPPDPNFKGPPPVVPVDTAWLVTFGFVLFTILVSALLYKYWEVPSRKWVNSTASKS